MFFLNICAIFLLTTFFDNFINAASIIINNVNINWQYGNQATNFSINAKLTAGLNPGLFI